MIEFVIESTISMIVFYGFYHFYLLKLKAFNFTRLYLLSALFFAILIPFISIPVNPDIRVVPDISSSIESYVSEAAPISKPYRFLSWYHVTMVLYLMVSSVLLIRFLNNLYKILRKIRKNHVLDQGRISFVLLDDLKTLPYSFFRYIHVNRFDYENNRIKEELLVHEEAHCLQYHSVDVLVAEILKVLLWFNPAIWLFGRAIQLNHEFAADNYVLDSHKLDDYQYAILDVVSQNDSTFLVSSFNYSLIKKRMLMMSGNKVNRTMLIFKKIAVVFLFSALIFTFSITRGTMSPLDNSHVLLNVLNWDDSLKHKSPVDEKSGVREAKDAELNLEISVKSKEVIAQNQEIAAQSREVAERSREIAAQSREAAERSREAAAQSRDVAERSREIAAQSRETAERSREIAAQSREVAERSREIAAQSRETAERSREIAALSREVAARNRETSVQNQEDVK